MSASAPKLDSDFSNAEIITLHSGDNIEQISTYSFSETSRLISIFSYICFSHFTAMLCGLCVIKLACSTSIKILESFDKDFKKVAFWSVFLYFFVLTLLFL